MRIEIIPCLKDNYSYLLIDESTNTACVIDPSEAGPVINFIEKENITLKYILNTHHHFDHIGGNIDLKNRYNSIVVGYRDDANRIPEVQVLVEDDQIWKADNLANENLPPVSALPNNLSAEKACFMPSLENSFVP